MIPAYARSQYQEMQVQTSPERLVVLLYDGAIGFLERGIDALQRGDAIEQGICLGKAQDILCHLLQTLDLKAGPIALQLQALYRYFLERLLTGNARNDLAALQEVAAALQALRSGWEAAEREVRTKRAEPVAPALSLAGASA